MAELTVFHELLGSTNLKLITFYESFAHKDCRKD